MPQPPNNAQIVYAALYQKAKLVNNRNVNILYFEQGEFYNIVRWAMNQLPPPNTSPEDEYAKYLQEPDENVVAALMCLGFTKKEARSAATNLTEKILDDRVAEAMKRLSPI